MHTTILRGLRGLGGRICVGRFLCCELRLGVGCGGRRFDDQECGIHDGIRGLAKAKADILAVALAVSKAEEVLAPGSRGQGQAKDFVILEARQVEVTACFPPNIQGSDVFDVFLPEPGAEEPSQNKVYISYGLRVYGIVPLAVKFITDDVDLSQLLVRDFDTLGILLGIKFAFDCQACVGRG